MSGQSIALIIRYHQGYFIKWTWIGLGVTRDKPASLVVGLTVLNQEMIQFLTVISPQISYVSRTRRRLQE